MPANNDINGKVTHVLNSTQTREHHCHWPGCETQVPPAMWGCRKHWYKIPSRLRHALWIAYRPSQEVDGKPSRAYIEIARKIQEWIKQNYPNG